MFRIVQKEVVSCPTFSWFLWPLLTLDSLFHSPSSPRVLCIRDHLHWHSPASSIFARCSFVQFVVQILRRPLFFSHQEYCKTVTTAFIIECLALAYRMTTIYLLYEISHWWLMDSERLPSLISMSNQFFFEISTKSDSKSYRLQLFIINKLFIQTRVTMRRSDFCFGVTAHS